MSLNLDEQYDKIYNYCYFKVKNRNIAEDLTQETFLKYFSQNSYINKGKPLAYLYTIAKNTCIDYFRKTPILLIDEDIATPSKIELLETNFAIKQSLSLLLLLIYLVKNMVLMFLYSFYMVMNIQHIQ